MLVRSLARLAFKGHPTFVQPKHTRPLSQHATPPSTSPEASASAAATLPAADLDAVVDGTATEAAALKARDFFGVHKLFTVKDLFDARVHLGHKHAELQMRPFIYGTRFDVNIIDLNETALLLRQALNFLAHIAYRGGIILFVARQPQMVHMVERAAIECGEYAHCRVWVEDIFTAPKETFGGSEIRLPDTIVLLHTKTGTKYDDHVIIKNAAMMGVPTVGVVDTDCNPNIITYPIPGNDDTLEATQLYLHLFKQAILLGKKKRAETTTTSTTKTTTQPSSSSPPPPSQS